MKKVSSLVLLFLCFVLLITGCNWHSHGSSASNESDVVYTSISGSIPLPQEQASIRSGLRTNVLPENFKVFFTLNGNQIPATIDPDSLNTANAQYKFEAVSNAQDVLIKSQLNAGDGFKDYYQTVISKTKITETKNTGKPIEENLTPESTAKAMLFEKKLEEDDSVTADQFENTLEQQEGGVWALLDSTGLNKNDFEALLNNLDMDSVAEKVNEAAKAIEIVKPTPTPEPTPTPTPTPETSDYTDQWPENEDANELKAIEWTPVPSLAEINSIIPGAALVENGSFVGSNVALRLAAIGSTREKIRTWEVFKPSERTVLVSGISTPIDNDLYAQGYEGIWYNNSSDSSSSVPSSSLWAGQIGQKLGHVCVKVTNGVADFKLLTATVPANEDEQPTYTTTSPNVLFHVYAAEVNGSGFVKIVNDLHGAARIYDCATMD